MLMEALYDSDMLMEALHDSWEIQVAIMGYVLMMRLKPISKKFRKSRDTSKGPSDLDESL